MRSFASFGRPRVGFCGAGGGATTDSGARTARLAEAMAAMPSSCFVSFVAQAVRVGNTEDKQTAMRRRVGMEKVFIVALMVRVEQHPREMPSVKGPVSERTSTPHRTLEVEMNVTVPREPEPSVELHALLGGRKICVGSGTPLRCERAPPSSAERGRTADGRSERQAASGFAAEHHVHDGMFHGLKCADRATELDARRGVVARERERPFDPADHLRREQRGGAGRCVAASAASPSRSSRAVFPTCTPSSVSRASRRAPSSALSGSTVTAALGRSTTYVPTLPLGSLHGTTTRLAAAPKSTWLFTPRSTWPPADGSAVVDTSFGSHDAPGSKSATVSDSLAVQDRRQERGALRVGSAVLHGQEREQRCEVRRRQEHATHFLEQERLMKRVETETPEGFRRRETEPPERRDVAIQRRIETVRVGRQAPHLRHRTARASRKASGFGARELPVLFGEAEEVTRNGRDFRERYSTSLALREPE